MMVDCKALLFAVGATCLLFFFIPIKLGNVEQVEERVLFEAFIKNYNKTYNIRSNEYEMRFKIFQESLKHIKTLNKKTHSLPSTAEYGITRFSDMNSTEFDDKYLTYEHKKDHHTRKRVSLKSYHPHNRNRLKREIGAGLPRSVDWRSKGFVTEIKNQKTCGACWAFSAVGVVESMQAIKTGKLATYSTQEIIDCARNGNMGCNGGDTCALLEWLVENNVRIQEEKEYPLVLQTQTCKLNQAKQGIQVASNFTCDYLVGYEDSILALLAYHGPVAVAVNALTWQFYIGGIIQFHCDGSLESLNHAVQLVGYNLDSTPPYYIARNSWGKSFGEKGYLRIAIGSNMCGIASEVAALDVL